MVSITKKTRIDMSPKGAGPFSVFSASDNIKYRKYQNRMALAGGKAVPLPREQWIKNGRPRD